MTDIQIIAFYEFRPLEGLDQIRTRLREVFVKRDVRGTVIIADEGYNGMVCGARDNIARFIEDAGTILGTAIRYKSSFHGEAPFRRIDVKIKPEIVTLKRPVSITDGEGTHVPPAEWNRLIDDPDTYVLDTRNDYEYRTGTFRGAVNPVIEKFSELPDFVAAHPDISQYKNIATFCTGGIRCEKFVPYLKKLGFENVYQLEGGILKYLEEIPADESLWDGECFVFDERISVGHDLKKGATADLSQRLTSRKDPRYKIEE